MAQRGGNGAARLAIPRPRAFGTAAESARSRLSILLSRESLLRLALSLVLSTALWLYVTAKQNPGYSEYPQGLSIGTSNVPIGLTVTNSLGVVHVTIHLDNPNVLVTPTSFRTFVDLFNYRAGAHPRVPVQVVADPGIHVGKISPAFVPVMLEPLRVKHVPVAINQLTNAPGGYTTGAVRLNPNTVTVSGPESVVSQIVRAQVDLNLAGARSAVSGSYKPALVDSQGRTVTITGTTLVQPPLVQVNVPIKALTSYRTVPVLPSLTGVPRTGYGLDGLIVNPAEVTARGLPGVLSRVRSVSTSPVSVAGKSASFSRQIRLRFPRGVSAGTKRVTVTVQMRPVGSSSSIEVGVVPENVAGGLVARIRPARVLVTVVSGASAIGNAVHGMHATVNIVGLGTGVYQLTPHIDVPRGFQVENVYPAQVTVTVGLTSSAP